ncbi:MAG: hypothetical protein Q8O57_05665 [Kiritimatiellota bacterium]|nr:hypothetical protein [Kiritimatiellota bacterium]
MAEWKTGQVILDDYLIEKELGQGGMGRVWLAKSNSTGHRFAVKQTLLKDDKQLKQASFRSDTSDIPKIDD